MKNKTANFIVLICLIYQSSTLAQNALPAKAEMFPAFIKYDKNQPVFTNGKIELTDEAGKKFIENNVKLQKLSTDKQSMNHYRYQQEYHNIPVENAIWNVHTKDGKIKCQNGDLVKSFPSNLASHASLNANQALLKALQHMNARLYKWQLPGEEKFLKKMKKDESATFYPEPTLVYYSGEGKVNLATLKLAYKFDIYAQEPLSRKYVFVDAMNGNILGDREQIQSGTAQTEYSGPQIISTDHFDVNSYRLRTSLPYDGYVCTRNMNHDEYYHLAMDFVDEDDAWGVMPDYLDSYALDAHWGGQMTYDYFLNRHGRHSLDDNEFSQFELRNFVHAGTIYYANAFWDGYGVSYGDGGLATDYHPLTTLDVVGHEFTHGFTSFSSGLIYSGESGALNEGFSDVFGTAIEAYARPMQWDWVILGDISGSQIGRDLSNPKAWQNPDTYYGEFWQHGGLDGGVHANSGVLNHWFYLLSVGGSGTNDHGVYYNVVAGVGMNAAADLAYELNAYYLTANSDYSDARALSIWVANAHMPQIALSTAEAWKAVGLYEMNCDPVVNLNVLGVTASSATLSWDLINSAVYYRIQYKASTSTTWINTDANSYTLAGLQASTRYDWRVTSSCSSDFSLQSQFTTSDQRIGSTIPSEKTLSLVGPNPSDGIFRIKDSKPSGILNYEITSANGVVVQKNSITANDEFVIDISKHAAGMYLLQISDVMNNSWKLRLLKK